MSSYVTEHTRRKPDGACVRCPDPINPGDRYRKAVHVQCDWLDRDFEIWLVHDHCAYGREEWELTSACVSRKRREASARRHAVDDWNHHHPPGTPVRYWPIVVGDESERQGETRGSAYLGCGGTRPMVQVTTYTGGIALTHVRVM